MNFWVRDLQKRNKFKVGTCVYIQHIVEKTSPSEEFSQAITCFKC